ncbi:hypothetical protein ACWGIV_35735, partial [Streptomyces sp. NPDC054844]
PVPEPGPGEPPSAAAATGAPTAAAATPSTTASGLTVRRRTTAPAAARRPAAPDATGPGRPAVAAAWAAGTRRGREEEPAPASTGPGPGRTTGPTADATHDAADDEGH